MIPDTHLLPPPSTSRCRRIGDSRQEFADLLAPDGICVLTNHLFVAFGWDRHTAVPAHLPSRILPFALFRRISKNWRVHFLSDNIACRFAEPFPLDRAMNLASSQQRSPASPVGLSIFHAGLSAIVTKP